MYCKGNIHNTDKRLHQKQDKRLIRLNFPLKALFVRGANRIILAFEKALFVREANRIILTFSWPTVE